MGFELPWHGRRIESERSRASGAGADFDERTAVLGVQA